ncbi:competence protein ComER [Paenibacillus cellulosilyticus]|uniref:Pyrroline-5-carboxylate reductase n=1 Tax=Paenibacillus cellulosilyticus TaxID=375489 RepID=A0A2V2YPI3_9BACL|nr:late competence protein ComER [Paenibacillus cellulosilyticus]PWV98410.1 competence protein ComER [Paenibacillus cellulosilyticus]QKS43258.1 late competence protein ComER [Paenibacillus cellulosilyticus]
MNVGFIGTGSMGSLLIGAFITSGALKPSQIAASNRTIAKVESLAIQYPGLRVKSTNVEAALGRDIVFLCIKPHEFHSVLADIRDSLRQEQLVVSITSPVMLAQLEDWLPCKAAKVIPSITNHVGSGATLCMYGSRVKDTDRERLEQLLRHISEPIRIDEQYTRIVSDLSSCGPAFFAFFVQRFVEAAVEETGISHEDALAVASAMLLGTGRLLTEGGMTPEQIQERVAVPGGITAKALELLNLDCDGMFNRLIRTTHAKYKEDANKVATSLYGEEVNGQ